MTSVDYGAMARLLVQQRQQAAREMRGRGLPMRDIAAHLGVSVATVHADIGAAPPDGLIPHDPQDPAVRIKALRESIAQKQAYMRTRRVDANGYPLPERAPDPTTDHATPADPPTPAAPAPDPTQGSAAAVPLATGYATPEQALAAGDVQAAIALRRQHPIRTSGPVTSTGPSTVRSADA